MEFEKRDIYADLGSGEFRVHRLVKSVGNRLSELAMANGYYDREIAGGEMFITLEGSFEAETEGGFFEELLDLINGSGIVDAEIAGEAYSLLVAVRAEVVLSEDSYLGKYKIVLKEI